MAASFDVVARLRADATQFIGQMKASQGAIGSFATKMGGLSSLGTATVAAGAVAAAALFKIGTDFDKAYDTIIVGTGASGAALDGLKQDFKSVMTEVPNAMGEVAVAIADINTRLGLTGEPLQETSRAMLDLSRITGTDLATNIRTVSRVLGDWGISATDATGSVDKIFYASQQTGISLDKLTTSIVQYGAPLRQYGFTMEQSIAMMSKFEKEGVNTETVMSGLRRGLMSMANAGKEPPVEFARVVTAIKNTTDAAEAATLASETFGSRAGPDMRAAIQEGRFEIEEFVKSLENADGSLQDAADRTASWQEELNKLKNKVLVALEPAATAVFNAITEMIRKVAPVLRNLIDVFMLAGRTLMTIIDPVKDVIKWFGLLLIAAKVFSLVQAMIVTLQTVAAGAFAKLAATVGQWVMDFLISMKVAEGTAYQAGIAIQSALGPVMVVLALAFGAFMLWKRGQEQSEASAKEFTQTLDDQTGAWTDNTRALVRNRLAADGTLDKLNDAGITMRQWQNAVQGSTGDTRTLGKQLATLTESLTSGRYAGADFGTAMKETRAELAAAGGDYATLILALADTFLITEDLVNQLNEEAAAYEEKQELLRTVGVAQNMATGLDKKAAEAAYDQASANEAAAEAIKKKTDELRASTDPVYAALSAQSSLTSAQKNYDDAMKDGTKSEQERTDASVALTKAYGDYGFALRDLEKANLEAGDAGAAMAEYMAMAVQLGLDPAAESTKRTLGAMFNLGTELNKIAAPTDEVKDAMERLKDPLYAMTDEGRLAAAQIAALGYVMKDLNGTQVWVKTNADTREAQAAVGKLARQLADFYAIQQMDTNLDWNTRVNAGDKLFKYANLARAYGYAAGGMVSDGLFVVGEQGPELGMKQGGAVRIFSNPQSRSMMTGAGTTASQEVNITINTVAGDPSAIERVVIDAIARASRRGSTVLVP